jgi:hypothetical protein
MIHDVDPLGCPVCGTRLSVIVIIRDPAEIRTIIACPATQGAASGCVSRGLPSTVGARPMRDEPFPSMDHHPRPSGQSTA